MERITLAREYRVTEWLRDAYSELTKIISLDFEKLVPEEPYSNPLDGNWEADAKKWEATSRDWETLARIFFLQTKVAASITSFNGCNYHCDECGMEYGRSRLCECRLLAMVDEAFRGELASYPGYIELPLPRKLPILFNIVHSFWVVHSIAQPLSRAATPDFFSTGFPVTLPVASTGKYNRKNQKNWYEQNKQYILV